MALQDLFLHKKHGHPNSCFSEWMAVDKCAGEEGNKVKNLPEHVGKPAKPFSLGQCLRGSSQSYRPTELQACHLDSFL